MRSERQERKGNRKARKEGEKKTEYICSVREIKCVFA
jgi:hypothetical protein